MDARKKKFKEMFLRFQVYKGLDIITAKVTKEEQAEVPHHMLSFLEPKYEFKVVDFRNKVLNIVSFYYFKEVGRLRGQRTVAPRG